MIYGEVNMPLEEVIANLEECRDAFTANIELLKRGIRPVNEDWQKCVTPMFKCMNYLVNNHSELIDNNEIKTSL